MLRTVIDTNIVVSAILWPGPPSHILMAARQNQVQLITSEALLDELIDVLSRRKFANRFTEIGRNADTVIANYRALTEVVNAPPLLIPVSDDPDDDAVLACGLGGKVDCIVSGDGDLLRLKAYESIPIYTVIDFLKQLNPP